MSTVNFEEPFGGGSGGSGEPGFTSEFAGPPEDLEEFQDEFADDSARTLLPAVPLPQGETGFLRPNGQRYTPRVLAGMQDIAFLRSCMEARENVLLYGPPGTGKTALPEAGAFMDAKKREDGSYEHLGMETIVCSVDTTEADFFGTFFQDPESGNFLWSPGPLQRAVEQDIPLYVDEVFLCDSRVLSSTLYPLMDGRGVLRIPMNPRLAPIPVGERFCVFGAGNPDVPGANFSEALRDRFQHQIEVETDWDLARALGVPQSVFNAAKALNIKRREGIISWSPQLRALLAFKSDRERYGKHYAYSALLGKAPIMDRDEIEQALHRSVRDSRDSKALSLGGEFVS